MVCVLDTRELAALRRVEGVVFGKQPENFVQTRRKPRILHIPRGIRQRVFQCPDFPPARRDRQLVIR
jgi:hypothetical protein